MSVAELGVGQEGRVDGVSGEDGLSRRLAELGFTRGQRVKVVRLAPLGDPMQVRLRGFDLAVRRSEARRIRLAPSGSDSGSR